jgi:hypothetical protein
MRYNNTERLGVLEADRIVTKNLQWIFREQSIADVGIDAIIEQVENGNPTGKFIAVQIKSGEGNFHITENKLIHYVSGIHYNYWLNLNVPLILIAHLPKTEKTYWLEINRNNFSKTKKKWKLEIPINNKFDDRARNKLKRIFSLKGDENFIFDLYKGKTQPDNHYDFLESIACIKESVYSMDKIRETISELTGKINEFTNRFIKYNEQGFSDKDAEVLACIKSIGRVINVTSKRMENEIEIFSQLYSEGIYALEYIYYSLHSIDEKAPELKDCMSALVPIPETISFTLTSILGMRMSVADLSGNYDVLKEAKKQYLEVIDILIDDFADAKKMTENLIGKFDSLKQP